MTHLSRRGSSVLLLVVLLSACVHPHPTLSPPGQIAVYGREVTELGRELVKSVEALATQGVIKKADAVAVLDRLAQVGTEASRLADHLRVIEQAGSQRALAVALARESLKELQRLLLTLTVPVSDEAGRAALVLAMDRIDQLVLRIAELLGGLS